jgi:hypothetical protein
VEKSCAGDRGSKGLLGKRLLSLRNESPISWCDGVMATMLRSRCGLLKMLRRVAKKRSAAHEQGLLSGRPEGEEFRAADAKGGKNGVRSVRIELQDVAGLI